MAEQLRLSCVRCQSTDTKFSYYNNYSRSQPRYFCITCRRYWTHGGSTRDVRLGGGFRRRVEMRNYTRSQPPQVVIVPADFQNLSLCFNVAATQGQSNPAAGVIDPRVIHNPIHYGPRYVVLMDPNDDSTNLRWDPSHFFPPNNGAGSTSGASHDHGPSSTSPPSA